MFIGYQNEMGNWLTWLFLMLVVIFVTIQMAYLNKSLDLFNTGIVTPVYYVMFTTLVITASAILFKEWKHLSYEVNFFILFIKPFIKCSSVFNIDLGILIFFCSQLWL